MIDIKSIETSVGSRDYSFIFGCFDSISCLNVGKKQHFSMLLDCYVISRFEYSVSKAIKRTSFHLISKGKRRLSIIASTLSILDNSITLHYFATLCNREFSEV